jgi:hypothetical protein
MRKTREELISLPLLVTRKTFLEWSGLDRDALRALIEQGTVRRWCPPHRTEAKYYRRDLEKLMDGTLA